MLKKTLTKEERDLLTNSTEFNKKIGKQEWRLADRTMSDLLLDGLDVYGGELRNVDILLTKMDNLHFRNFTFNKVRFHEGRIKNAIFENVVFNDCEFILEVIDSSKCIKCRFSGTTVERGTGENSGYYNTEFQSHSETQSSYRNMNFEDVKYINSKLTADYYDSIFKNYSLENVAGKMKYGSKSVANFSIKGGDVDASFYGEINYFIATSAKSIKLKFGMESKVKSVKLSDIELVKELIFAKNSTHEAIRIQNIKVLDEFTLGGEVKDLLLNNCNLMDSYFLFANIVNNVSFEKSPIKGLTIENSKLNGVKFIDSDIYDYLFVRNSTLKDIEFRNSRVRAGTEIIDENSQYSAGGKFPIER